MIESLYSTLFLIPYIYFFFPWMHIFALRFVPKKIQNSYYVLNYVKLRDGINERAKDRRYCGKKILWR